ncbi:hypothetical protein GW17_00042628 [Ensete ventricosum]|nr:hypothetical protein GW17_00042628 [Ensete ventricosum]
MALRSNWMYQNNGGYVPSHLPFLLFFGTVNMRVSYTLLLDKCVMASSGFQGGSESSAEELGGKAFADTIVTFDLWFRKGLCLQYDAVGSYERVGYSAHGTGAGLIMPVLDNQLKSPSPLLFPTKGDKVEILVINASGIRQELTELRKD